jgi:nucleotide-binding universal stress UspA family protein
MFKKVLLPVDLSNRHGQALKIGYSLALQNRGELILLHVIELISGLSMREEKAFYEKLEKAAETHLRKLAKKGSAKITVRRRIILGRRGASIIKFATQMGADLIVLTAPKVDFKNPSPGWGSLSYKISILARCPVLLVK